jgi:hypothetical protein
MRCCLWHVDRTVCGGWHRCMCESARHCGVAWLKHLGGVSLVPLPALWVRSGFAAIRGTSCRVLLQHPAHEGCALATSAAAGGLAP